MGEGDREGNLEDDDATGLSGSPLVELRTDRMLGDDDGGTSASVSMNEDMSPEYRDVVSLLPIY